MNAVPKGIEFYLPAKIRADGGECRVTEATYGGNKTVLLNLPRSTLVDAGFKGGDRVVLLRGRPPHDTWVRVEKAKFGKKLSDKGAVSLSLKAILKGGLGLKNEVVKPIMGEGAVYFQLPATWFTK